jgi:hypothetical protein
MKLKNLGIYALPDGREFVVDVEASNVYRLCSRHTWNFTRAPEYTVTSEGKIVNKGQPTGWGVEHLVDTGRREQYPKATFL